MGVKRGKVSWEREEKKKALKFLAQSLIVVKKKYIQDELEMV